MMVWVLMVLSIAGNDPPAFVVAEVPTEQKCVTALVNTAAIMKAKFGPELVTIGSCSPKEKGV